MSINSHSSPVGDTSILSRLLLRFVVFVKSLFCFVKTIVERELVDERCCVSIYLLLILKILSCLLYGSRLLLRQLRRLNYSLIECRGNVCEGLFVYLICFILFSFFISVGFVHRSTLMVKLNLRILHTN